ncbi:MAG: hypothetical protein GC182_20335 [Rhodopseudomonas sp.]|nr:hypothetical protein [Rhodopseudomonas sp.]
MNRIETMQPSGRGLRISQGAAGAAGWVVLSLLTIVSAAQAQQAGSSPGVEAPQSPLRQDAAPTPETAPEASAGKGRYTFNKVDGGVLRLDSVSGQVAACSQHGAGWVCQAVPEERVALEKEIGRLQSEVASLRAEVAELRVKADASTFSSDKAPPRPPADLSPRPGARPDSAQHDSAKPDSGQSILPSHEQIERAKAALQNAWERLVDMIVGFKNDVMRKG